MDIYIGEDRNFKDIEKASLLELSTISWNSIIENTIT